MIGPSLVVICNQFERRATELVVNLLSWLVDNRPLVELVETQRGLRGGRARRHICANRAVPHERAAPALAARTCPACLECGPA